MLRQDYFKGWYFKCSNKEKNIAFIPAFHQSGREQSASLQVITEDAAFRIPSGTLNYREKPLSVKFDNCIFSGRGIKLDIKNDGLAIRGTLRFRQLSPIRYDIMGPFQFVPFMQCRHRIYSMRHQINGQLICNGQPLHFQDGSGYIEGDRGSSFPKQYVWTQCCFQNSSLMLSAADIPILGTHFTGIIGVILLNKTEYRLATYLGAEVKYVGKNTIIVEQGGYEFTAALIKKNAQPLYAPNRGKMNRTIHESASCQAYYRFSHKGKLLCEFTSDKASFEFEFH